MQREHAYNIHFPFRRLTTGEQKSHNNFHLTLRMKTHKLREKYVDFDIVQKKNYNLTYSVLHVQLKW